jgi:hypothetical protein
VGQVSSRDVAFMLVAVYCDFRGSAEVQIADLLRRP